MASANDILDFWFDPRNRKAWFQSTPAFDRAICDHFESTWQQAAAGRLADWEDSASGALALVIVLDQFPLNMYRDQARAYSTESAARAVSARALERGWDADLDDDQRLFLYLPWMHSESLQDQQRCLELFGQAGMDDRFAKHHHGIVSRFGRFPHRNEVLGRPSTAEEIAWLNSDEGFSG